MARYTYNAGLVTQTMDKLNSACNSIKNTNVDIQKGISTIYNARGAELMDVDFSVITNYQSQVTEAIDMMSTELRNKATEIEEYQSAPWYKKVFATLGLGALKIVEGIGTFGENIMDGVVSIVGFIGGIFSSDFQDCIAEFVEKDYVGDYFAEEYEEGNLQWLNKYSAMSHTSTCANLLKGVGSALPVIVASIAITVATGGATAPALIATAGLVFVQGIGSGTQAGLQAGNSFNQAFGQGVKEGAVAAAATLILGGAANRLGSLASGLDDAARAVAGVSDDTITALTKLGVENTDDVLSALASSVDETGNALQTIAQESAEQATKVGADLVSATDDAKNIVQRVAGGVSKRVDKAITNFGTNTRVGKTMVNAVAKIGGTGTNAVAATVGVANTHPIADSMATTAHRVIQNAEPTIGQSLYNNTNLQDNGVSPSVATQEQAAQNLQNLKDQGYQQSTSNTPATGTNTGTGSGNTGGNYSSGGGSYSSGSSSYSTPSNTPVEVSKPDFSTSNSQSNTSSGTHSSVSNNTGTTSTPSNQQSTNDIISSAGTGITPGGTSTNNSSPNIGGLLGKDAASVVEDVVASDSSVVSEEVLNSLGDVSGSLTGITGGSSRTNIPTSSAPIVTPEIKSSSSMIPLSAGLGAAAAAGIGAKAYMDKRERAKEENEDSINTEEWEEDADSLSVDYEENDLNEAADYLSPKDEYAFQE